MLATLIAALLLGSQNVPTVDFFTEFRNTCGYAPGNFELTRDRLNSEGWAPVEMDSNASLNALATMGAGQISPGERGWLAWRRSVNGVTLHILLTRETLDGSSTVGCYMNNFGGAEAFDPHPVSAWLGMEPTQVFYRPGGVDLQKWNNPTNPEIATVQNTYLPAESPVVAQLGFSGPSLVIIAWDSRVAPN